MTPEGISFIIPVRNGASRLPALLRSIRSQRYPQALIDLVVVDDDSTDATAHVAASFGARVIRHDSHDCERGKAIGLDAALHDVVAFVDDDNVLLGDDWLEIALNCLQDSVCTAVQPARFHYDRADTPANRYQSIFGGTDPVVLYLGRCDRLPAWATNWGGAGHIVEETNHAWTVRFVASSLPTLGAQGFLARKSVLRQAVCAPLYFHIDVCAQLAQIGLDRFAMLKRPIVHHHCETFGQMLRKMRRNFRRFLRDKRARTYRYETTLMKKAFTGLLLASAVVPAATALRAYVKTRDAVCLMHPLICAATVALYAYETVAHVFEAAGSKVAPRGDCAS
jgi:glycosyltransferase involved in cell wall biosynthesis